MSDLAVLSMRLEDMQATVKELQRAATMLRELAFVHKDTDVEIDHTQRRFADYMLVRLSDLGEAFDSL